MIAVTVQKNGRYWQAKWRQNGEQFSKGLGAMSKVSKRAAGVEAKRIEVKLNGEPFWRKQWIRHWPEEDKGG